MLTVGLNRVVSPHWQPLGSAMGPDRALALLRGGQLDLRALQACRDAAREPLAAGLLPGPLLASTPRRRNTESQERSQTACEGS